METVVTGAVSGCADAEDQGRAKRVKDPPIAAVVRRIRVRENVEPCRYDSALREFCDPKRILTWALSLNAIRVMGTRIAGGFLQSALLIVYRFCQVNGIQKCIL